MPIIKKFLLLCFCSFFFNSSYLFGQDSIISQDSANYGFIHIIINADSSWMILNNKFDEGRFIKSGEIIKAKTGRTSIKLSVINDFLFEEVFALHKDSTVLIDHKFESLPISKEVLNNNYAARQILGKNLLIVTDESSEIILNDTNVGTGFSFTNGQVGDNKLQVKNPDSYSSIFYNQQTRFSNSDLSFRIVEKYVKPDKGVSRKIAFIPGASQSYKYQPVKSSLIKIGMGLAFLSTSTFELKYRKNRSDFDEVLEQYQQSSNSSEVTTLGNRLDDLNETLESDSFFRNLSLASLISIYVYNLVDGIYGKPRMGYREVKPLQFYLESSDLSGINGTVKISIPTK